ncbi:MAG: alpha/beta hydrolase [Clostridia bacterium]|nr:alpha/beta hydrolase [Clostridia bacterium]
MEYKNFPFKYCGSIALLGDLWTPDEIPAGGCPLVLFFHGGGWRFGDKSGWAVTWRWKETLRKRGVAFATMGYRHGGYGGGLEQLAADAADAVRFFRKRGAEYGIDGERIVLCGHSAGGHISMLTGFVGERFRDAYSDKETECRVLGAISIAGPANLRFFDYPETPAADEIPGDLQLLLGKNWQDPAVIERAEPLHYVMTGEAAHIPVLCLQGMSDRLVPPRMAEEFCRVGRENGYDTRHLPLPETGHCLETPGKGGSTAPAALAADADICRFVMELLGEKYE